MAIETAQLLARPRIPQAQGVIIAAGEYQLIVWAECHGHNAFGMTSEAMQLFARLRIPESKRLIIAGG
jgi:hypothetical protein